MSRPHEDGKRPMTPSAYTAPVTPPPPVPAVLPCPALPCPALARRDALDSPAARARPPAIPPFRARRYPHRTLGPPASLPTASTYAVSSLSPPARLPAGACSSPPFPYPTFPDAARRVCIRFTWAPLLTTSPLQALHKKTSMPPRSPSCTSPLEMSRFPRTRARGICSRTPRVPR